MRFNRRRTIASVLAGALSVVTSVFYARGQKPPPAFDQALIAAIGVLLAPVPDPDDDDEKEEQ